MMSSTESKATLGAPASTSTVRVRMLDTTTYMTLRSESFLHPVPPGHETANMSDIAFLIENDRLGKKALFDLGARKDFWNHAPAMVKRLSGLLVGLKIEKDARDILEEKSIPLDTINDIFWSHWHWDHTGDPSRFPPTTNLVYGPGVSSFKPGYPVDPSATVSSSSFSDRRNIEIDFSSSPLKIGGFPAHDYYGDGSFYLLETPGHAIGHMCGLARTTPDTFILMGGDICHFPGDFRPNRHYPFPNPVSAGILDKSPVFPIPCPGSFFLDSHPQFPPRTHTHDDDDNDTHTTSSPSKTTTPFYTLPTGKITAYENPSTEVAQATVDNLGDSFDGASNVFVAIAHDPALLETLPTLNTQPERDLNDWAAQGWKDKCYWGWLNELPRQGKPGRDRLVVGWWLGGKKFETPEELLEAAEKGTL